MNVLVVGGAGYIGSTVARRLAREGHSVWIYDNLSRGHRAAALPGRLIEGDIADSNRVAETLAAHGIETVFHFAAFALVGESMVDPALYYRQNVLGSFHLLEGMRRAKVRRIVFSSTTATYGEPDHIPITEDSPQRPINTYGMTKFVVEKMLEDYARAYGFGVAALRYFNAAGAVEDGSLGEDHTPETHLIPIVFQVALGQRPAICVHGDDYPTRDGTCIRDYVHVEDLADAHIRVMQTLEAGTIRKMNLGIGRGFSVLEVIEACRRVTGHPIPVEIGPRRPGDPAELIASGDYARQFLGWKPRFTEIDDIVATAWRWHQRRPHGYGDEAAT